MGEPDGLDPDELDPDGDCRFLESTCIIRDVPKDSSSTPHLLMMGRRGMNSVLSSFSLLQNVYVKIGSRTFFP